jgi:REP element-mobilizing transposase RayT
MANTYTQIYLHLVFCQQGSENRIPKGIKEELQKYTTGIIQNRKHKLLAINFMPDHVPILVGFHPSQSVSDLVRDIKANTSKFIHEKRLVPGKFSWQEGYGPFSYSRSQIDDVIQYIKRQEEHHKRQPFKEEYLAILQKFEVEYDDRYLFEWY